MTLRPYAKTTRVDVTRSRAELERTLARYGATDFVVVEDPARARIRFALGSQYVQFVLPLPDRTSPAFTHTPSGKVRTPSAQERAYEQAVRQRWRALVLATKGKFEAVDAGISSFEDEFLGSILLADGSPAKRNGSQPRPRRSLARRSQSVLIGLGAGLLVPVSGVAAMAVPASAVQRIAEPVWGEQPDVLGANRLSVSGGAGSVAVPPRSPSGEAGPAAAASATSSPSAGAAAAGEAQSLAGDEVALLVEETGAPGSRKPVGDEPRAPDEGETPSETVGANAGASEAAANAGAAPAKAEKAQQKASAKADKAAEKAAEKAANEQAKAGEEAAQAAEKAAREQAKAAEKAAREQAKAAEQAAKAAEQAAREQAKAAEKAAKEEAKADEQRAKAEGTGTGRGASQAASDAHAPGQR